MARDPFVEAFLSRQEGGGGSSSMKSYKDPFVGAFIARQKKYRDEDEENGQSNSSKLKEQAQQQTTDQNKKAEEAKKKAPSFKPDPKMIRDFNTLNEDFKNKLKQSIGEDKFNILRDAASKPLANEAPKQSFFDKLKDKVDPNSELDIYKRADADRKARQEADNANIPTMLRKPLPYGGKNEYVSEVDGIGGLAKGLGKGVTETGDAILQGGRYGLGTITGNRDARDSAARQFRESAGQSLPGQIYKPLEDMGVNLGRYTRAELSALKEAYSTGQEGSFMDKLNESDRLRVKKLKEAGLTGDITRDIVAPSADTALNILTLGTTGFAGKKLAKDIAKDGVKAGSKDALKILGKTTKLNALQGGAAELYKEDPTLGGALKEGAKNAVAGTAGDLLLGSLPGIREYAKAEKTFEGTAAQSLKNLNNAKANKIMDIGRKANEADGPLQLGTGKIEKPGYSTKEYSQKYNDIAESYRRSKAELDKGGELADRVTQEQLDTYHLDELKKLDEEYLTGPSVDPVDAQYINENVASYGTPKEYLDSVVDTLWENNKKGKGVETALLPGDGYDFSGRVNTSNNSQFYQDFYKANGYAPTKKAIREMVEEELTGDGTRSMGNVLDSNNLNGDIPHAKTIYNQLKESEASLGSRLDDEGAIPLPDTERGFTRPTPDSIDTPVVREQLTPAQAKASKRVAEIDKITKQVQTRGAGKYTPDDLRELMRERNKAKAIADGTELAPPSIVERARRDVPESSKQASRDVSSSYAEDVFNGSTDKLGYEDLAQVSGITSGLDRLVAKGWNASKGAVMGTKAGGKLFEGIGRAFDDQSGILSLVKRAEAKGRLKAGTADMVRKRAGDIRRSVSESSDFLRDAQSGKDFRGSIVAAAENGKMKFDEAQRQYGEFAKAKSELEIDNLYRNTEGKAGRELSPEKRLELETQANQYRAPEMEAAFDASVRVYKDLLDDKLESGMITKQAYDSLNDLPYDYTRQQRFLEEWEMDNKNTSAGFGGMQKRSKHSTTRELLDPTETMLAYTQRHFADKAMNEYKSQVIGALEEAGEASFVPKDSKATGHTDTVYRNGEKLEYQVPKEVKHALDTWAPKEVGAMTNFARAANNIFKYGTTTGNVGFVVRNLAVDSASALINSDNTLRLATQMPLFWADALGIPTGKFAKQYKQMAEDAMGNNTTRVSQYHDQKSTKRATQEFVRQDASLRSKGAHVAKTKGEFAQQLKKTDDIIGRSEIATRAAAYKATYKKLLKQGEPIPRAKEAAALAAREITVEFAAGGSSAKTINMVSPYFNTKMQVPRTLARNLEKKPVSTAMKMATVVGAPMMALTLWNTGDPKRKEVYDDLDDRTKEDYFVHISDGAHKNDKGQWEGVTLVRKPNDVSVAFEGFRKYIEKAASDDPDEHASWMQIIKDTAGAAKENAPVPLTINDAANAAPPLAKTAVEAVTNRSLYYGQDLVPEYIKKKSENPEDQHYDNYSRTSKFLGGLLNTSPVVVDNFIRGNFGEVGTQIQNTVDKLTGGKENRTNEDGENYSDIGGRSPFESVTRNFEAVRGGEVQRQFWDQIGTSNSDTPMQNAKSRASKKVTKAVNDGDYAKAQRLAEEWNEGIAEKVTPFIRKYGKSEQWDPEWDEYLDQLFIKSTPQALKYRKKD